MSVEGLVPDDDAQPRFDKSREPERPMAAVGTLAAHRSELGKSIAQATIDHRKKKTQVKLGQVLLVLQDGAIGIGHALIPSLGRGSIEPIYPKCPKCDHVHRFEVRSTPLETLWRLTFGDEHARPIYTDTLTCDDCLKQYEENTATERAKRKARTLEALGFTKVYQQWTFETYPNQNSAALKRAQAFCGNPAHDLVIWGNPGVGKTGLAIAILRDLFERGRQVRFLRASELLLMMRATFKQPALGDGPASELAVIRSLHEIEILCLDDFGSIKTTEYFDDIVATLLDMRQKADLPTIITLNMRVRNGEDPSEKWINFFGHVAYDRLRERAEFWNVTGRSQRQTYQGQ